MKTLDEVIKDLEECMKNDAIESEGFYLATDSLHYLKKLKRIEERMERIALGNIEDTLSKMDNPPLTWGELREMKGKPVWVEVDTPSTKYQRWVLICEYTDSNKITIIANHLLTQITPEDYGKGWQAFRKERE